MLFSINDIVILTTDFPQHGVAKGTMGTVVHVFSYPNDAYELEFCDDQGRTIAEFPVLPEQVTAYKPAGSTAHAAE